MIQCNRVITTHRTISENIIVNGGAAIKNSTTIQTDVWVMTDENEKYLGTILLHLPLSKGDCIGVTLQFEDMENFSACFKSIQKEYPESIFEIRILLAYEEKCVPYIVEQAHFILKERNENFACFHYVNGPKD